MNILITAVVFLISTIQLSLSFKFSLEEYKDLLKTSIACLDAFLDSSPEILLLESEKVFDPLFRQVIVTESPVDALDVVVKAFSDITGTSVTSVLFQALDNAEADLRGRLSTDLPLQDYHRFLRYLSSMGASIFKALDYFGSDAVNSSESLLVQNLLPTLLEIPKMPYPYYCLFQASKLFKASFHSNLPKSLTNCLVMPEFNPNSVEADVISLYKILDSFSLSTYYHMRSNLDRYIKDDNYRKRMLKTFFPRHKSADHAISYAIKMIIIQIDLWKANLRKMAIEGYPLTLDTNVWTMLYKMFQSINLKIFTLRYAARQLGELRKNAFSLKKCFSVLAISKILDMNNSPVHLPSIVQQIYSTFKNSPKEQSLAYFLLIKHIPESLEEGAPVAIKIQSKIKLLQVLVNDAILKYLPSSMDAERFTSEKALDEAYSRYNMKIEKFENRLKYPQLPLLVSKDVQKNFLGITVPAVVAKALLFEPDFREFSEYELGILLKPSAEVSHMSSHFNFEVDAKARLTGNTVRNDSCCSSKTIQSCVNPSPQTVLDVSNQNEQSRRIETADIRPNSNLFSPIENITASEMEIIKKPVCLDVKNSIDIGKSCDKQGVIKIKAIKGQDRQSETTVAKENENSKKASGSRKRLKSCSKQVAKRPTTGKLQNSLSKSALHVHPCKDDKKISFHEATDFILNDKVRAVSHFDTQDFRLHHHEANVLFEENLENQTAQDSAARPNGKYSWIFNPSIVIDGETYNFLSQAFGLLPGVKSLTFTNFTNAFLKLNPGMKQESLQVKHKAVFKFSHVMVIDNIAYIPRIGSVHEEHNSSRFNHKQVRKFLDHAGAHPYFFKKLT